MHLVADSPELFLQQYGAAILHEKGSFTLPTLPMGLDKKKRKRSPIFSASRLPGLYKQEYNLSTSLKTLNLAGVGLSSATSICVRN
jgi:hypothetical protein